MGILTDDLVKQAQKYLEADKEIRNNVLVREILLVFPNSNLFYKGKK